MPLRDPRVVTSGEVDTLDNVVDGNLESVSPLFVSVNSSSLISIGDGVFGTFI